MLPFLVLKSWKCMLPFTEFYSKSLPTPISKIKRLAQELMIRKCKDWDTKNNCYIKKLVTTYTINQLHSSHWTPSSLKDIDKDMIHIPKLFLQDPQQIKSADQMHVKPRPVETRRLTKLASSPWCQSIQELSTNWSCTLWPPPSNCL